MNTGETLTSPGREMQTQATVRRSFTLINLAFTKRGIKGSAGGEIGALSTTGRNVQRRSRYGKHHAGASKN